MTAAEMKSEFLTRYDAASSAASPGWEDSEISEFLNIGQFNVVTSLYNSQRLDLLAEIVVERYILSEDISEGMLGNIYKINLPNDCMYYVDCALHITKNVSGNFSTFFTAPENITYTQYKQFITTPDNRTLFRKPKAFVHNESLTVIVDSISTIYKEDGGDVNTITYVRFPLNIVIGTSNPSPVNCELNKSLHKLVVEEAVNQAIKAVSLTKVKTQQ